ncbi:TadE/TadG family type IV pilus assembly protein [Endozoicomonas montiporae]|uniref:Tight adherence protein E n=1 Tax=Endozoicomonas montiporae CL-33 TaxID=570277 RepID=A0A142BB06_9GAMM|nr:hypothetical protein [Endozoicomonas montiporae]AMO55932.1 tight adherence protein E [Endozoicomonas montiporae CL-33]
MNPVPVKKKKQQGVVAIETALGLFGFLLMIFYWMEVSYMGFVSALMDYTVSEVSREARTGNHQGNYQAVVERAVFNSTDSLWMQFLDTSKITVSVRFFKGVDQLAEDDCELVAGDCPSGAPRWSPIAVYQVSYPYQPLSFALFSEPNHSMRISREVIAIQEYERDEFDG